MLTATVTAMSMIDATTGLRALTFFLMVSSSPLFLVLLANPHHTTKKKPPTMVNLGDS
jgi:hypothetical protein